jgi:two-component system chemotaxis response regulator CheB
MVAIGASGGEGLDDLRDLLSRLPRNLAAVVLVVLHRSSEQSSELRAVLARASRLPVLIASEGDRFRVGHCYVGEPNAHLSLAANSNVRLVEGGENRHRNRTVDILFDSVAVHAGARGIGVVLSGALDDGSRGLAAIRHAGGMSMVISHGGAAEWGMPLNAAEFDGPVDVVGSTAQIAQAIEARVASA